MWVAAEYEATSLFSLKSPMATSSGAKSLLVPTPFAVKMALLDCVCRTEGAEAGRAAWEWLRSLRMAIRPARYAVVSNVFAKILKPRRGEPAEGSADQGPYQRTIAYREYVQLVGPLGIALGGDGGQGFTDSLVRWMAGISYLGKRGSFVQVCGVPSTEETLPTGFVEVRHGLAEEFPLQGVLQMLDECDPKLTFDHVSIYSEKALRRGKDRLFCHTVLPYRVLSSSRGYTAYERIDDRETAEGVRV